MLQVCDTLKVSIAEQLSKNRVIGNSQGPPLISVGNMRCFYTVRQDWHTVRLNQSEKNHIIRSPFDAQYGIQRSVEAFHPFSDRTSESSTTTEDNTKVFPFRHPLNIRTVKSDLEIQCRAFTKEDILCLFGIETNIPLVTVLAADIK